MPAGPEVSIIIYAGASGHYEEIAPIVEELRKEYAVTILTNRTPFTSGLAQCEFVLEFGPSALGQLLAVAGSFVVGLRQIVGRKPRVVLCTGPISAIGVLVAARLVGVRSIYLDTLCRYRDLSGTGKMARLLAHTTLVQWPHLIEKAGRHGAYWGNVI